MHPPKKHQRIPFITRICESDDLSSPPARNLLLQLRKKFEPDVDMIRSLRLRFRLTDKEPLSVTRNIEDPSSIRRKIEQFARNSVVERFPGCHRGRHHRRTV